MDTRAIAEEWLVRLKNAWEGGDSEAAVALFSATREYYERPFKPGTTQEEFGRYWADIHGLRDIKFDYTVEAVEGRLAVAHWRNSFTSPDDDKSWLLDGVFFIEFDEEGRCIVFRQWWFAAD
jgi:hypothetical protein